MLKKTFCITMFGSTFEWMPQFIDHVQHLGPLGWEWLVFTPNTDVQSKGNVNIIPMTTGEFVGICEKRLGVKPFLYMNERGVPSVHVTDFYVASGLIFEKWLHGSDFWGITNMDVVYGRLDHFLPDSVLENCDIMTDDTLSFNGVFSLLRNREDINNLFREIPDWEKKFTLPPCPKCNAGVGGHTLAGTDEYDMTVVADNAASEGRIRYIKPQYYPMHSHDRLEQHVPEPKLEIMPDGSLWELFKDIKPPKWIHAHPFLGNEIGYFHFPKTKKWPNIIMHDLPQQ